MEPSDPTDGQMIAASHDDPEQFGIIFDRHFDDVWRYLAANADRSTADELSSRVFLKAFEIRHRFETERTQALPWLLSIARGLLLHHYRRFQTAPNKGTGAAAAARHR